jgi:hypothetical protein
MPLIRPRTALALIYPVYPFVLLKYLQFAGQAPSVTTDGLFLVVFTTITLVSYRQISRHVPGVVPAESPWLRLIGGVAVGMVTTLLVLYGVFHTIGNVILPIAALGAVIAVARHLMGERRPTNQGVPSTRPPLALSIGLWIGSLDAIFILVRVAQSAAIVWPRQ